MTHLKDGDIAPDFSVENADGKITSLSNFIGNKLVLYFYPKDNTPGCTAEACNLRDNFQLLKNKGFQILGVSPDDETSHQKFSSKYDLPFELIPDTNKKILKDYGVWGQKKMFGKIKEGVLRTTFIIDKKGNIEKVFDKVQTKNHTQQILNEY